MQKVDNPELIYLGRSRLHRNRANLIQTLHTVAALAEIGVKARLYLPPWHKTVTPQQRCEEMGISITPDIRGVQLLHRRWPKSLFPRFYKRQLRKARAIYVRSPELSLGLASQGLTHHFEVHTLQPMRKKGMLDRIIDNHRRGLIGYLIPISQSAAAALLAAGADETRIHVSPSGVDLRRFNALPGLEPERLVRPRIIYLGRISRARGLQILTHLAASGSGEVRLVGDCEDRLTDLPDLHHQPAVPHRDVASLYAESELVVLPYQLSLDHADAISPMKLFEAMAAGRAIVASDIPPIREILEHGRNALLAPPDNPAAWEEAVKTLMHNRQLAGKLAQQARQDATAYSWPNRAAGIARAIGLRN
ncbi:MAG: glycosyltransferase family 4 protein [Candidatus Thiodiazotropha sp.]